MAEKWIQKAIKKPGALRSALGVKEGKTTENYRNIFPIPDLDRNVNPNLQQNPGY